MNNELTNERTQPNQLRRYTIGFITSLVLTAAAYLLILKHTNNDHSSISHEVLITAVISLAIVQLLVQAVYFLGVGFSKEKRLNTVVFAFMLLIVLIIVIGSIWIMHNLNYNMMSPEAMDARMHHESQKGF